jgi:DNA-binding CsgD family transcriptional regulator
MGQQAAMQQSEDQVPIRTSRISNRMDFAGRLTACQKIAHARNYCVLRASGSNFPAKKKLQIAQENWGAEGQGQLHLMVDSYSDFFMAHLEVSSTPVIWNGMSDMQTAESPDFSAFLTRIKSRILPFSGIAFPVRLGNVGSGYVIFTANFLDMNSETIVDLHGKSFQFMIDMLQLDERRNAKPESLTDREITCLQMAGDGHISEEIGERLGLSVHTVNAYLGTAATKLDSVNRIQAIAKAIRLGFIT